MNAVLWVLQALLAAAFLGAGLVKLVRPRRALVDGGQMEWAEDFSDESVKAIGAFEVLAAVGLVVPPLVGIAELLVPVAASGLVLIMVGAAITHARRDGEGAMVGANVVLGGLAAVVAWGRFGPYAL